MRNGWAAAVRRDLSPERFDLRVFDRLVGRPEWNLLKCSVEEKRDLICTLSSLPVAVRQFESMPRPSNARKVGAAAARRLNEAWGLLDELPSLLRVHYEEQGVLDELRRLAAQIDEATATLPKLRPYMRVTWIQLQVSALVTQLTGQRLDHVVAGFATAILGEPIAEDAIVTEDAIEAARARSRPPLQK